MCLIAHGTRLQIFVRIFNIYMHVGGQANKKEQKPKRTSKVKEEKSASSLEPAKTANTSESTEQTDQLPESQWRVVAEAPTEPDSDSDGEGGEATECAALHEDLHEELYGCTPVKDKEEVVGSDNEDQIPPGQPSPVPISDDEDGDAEQQRTAGANKDCNMSD